MIIVHFMVTYVWAHINVNMKRWGPKMKLDREVSRWLLQMRKEPVDEAPLVVSKVIRQYTRKKKVSPAEPENKVVTPDVVTVHSEQTVSKVEVIDNLDHVKMKEEYIPDIKVQNVVVENHVKMKEPNAFQNKNNSVTLEKNGLHIKEENYVKNDNRYLTEFKIIKGINSQQEKDSVSTKKENVFRIISSNSNISEREQEPSKMDVTIKMEPVDDSEKTDLDQEYIAGCHLEEGKTVGIKPKTEPIKCDSYNASDKMNEASIMELGIMNEDCTMGQNLQENHLKYNLLLTEEINIKDEIETDDNDSELAMATIKEEPACDAETEPAIVSGITNGSESLAKQSGGAVKTCSNKPDTIALKKCYLVAVDVAPSTSGIRRQISHSRPVALLAADSQKAVNPENLAGFKVVAKSQIFTCDMCSEHFLSKADMRRHMRGMHAVAMRFQCHCGASFSHNYMLLAHMRAHTGSLICDMCPKRFKSTQKYAHHLNTHLLERLFSCPICVRRYPVLNNLQRHVARHSTSDIFQCTSCSASYRCITDLRRHSEREHGEQVEYPCYVCTQTLSSNAEFIAHVKSHDNALHECAFCSKRFTDFFKWEEHSAGHIERLDVVAPVMLPYACSVCRKRFEYRSLLKTHMRCHTGERPYTCKECSKTFKTSSAVAEHEKGHDRPYLCLECSARFAKRDSLVRHMRLHSGERPHICPVCARTFAQRFAMTQHVKRFHTPGLKRVPMKAGRQRNPKK